MTAAAVGTYLLTATDGPTGCRGGQSVVIPESRDVPAADAGTDALLTCASPTQILSAGTPGMRAYAYAWTAPGPDALVGPTDGASAEAVAAGTYVLTVTDVDNGCSDSDDVTLREDLRPCR